MPGREYVCGECGHRFRTPQGAKLDTRSLMCPSCGSIDLAITVVERSRPVVMRAREPVQTGDLWGEGGREAS